MRQHPKQSAREQLVTHLVARLDTPGRPWCTGEMVGLVRVLADTALEIAPVTLLRTPASVVSTLAITFETGMLQVDGDDPLLYDRIQRQAHEELSRLEAETLSNKDQTRMETLRCLWRRVRWTR